MPSPLLPPSAEPGDAYWRVLFRQAVDPMLVYPLDAEGRPLPYIEVNDAALALYGYTREEMLARSVYDLADADRDTITAAVASLRDQPDIFLRGHHRHRDGRRIPVEVHAHLVELGGRPAVFAVSRDLTPRLEAEAEARLRERRFTEVLARTSDDVLILDRDWRILHLNPATKAAIGPAIADGAEGRVFWEVFPQLLGSDAEEPYRRAMETRTAVTFEARGALTGRYLEVRIYPAEEGLVVFGRDFTARYLAEERQRRQSERLRALADAARAVTAAPSLEAKLDVITEEARRILGAHQAVTSLTDGPDWSQAIHATSLSEKYAAYRDYAQKPTGQGIYAEVCRTNRPMRMTQAELEAHPRWRGFGGDGAHPPMNGWLAVPLIGREGANLGLIQLSDKGEEAFDEEDEAILTQLAGLASSAVEAVRAEAERVAAAERFRVIVSQALVGVAQTDLSGRFTYANDRFAEIVGYEVEEIVGRSMQEITHPDDLPRNLPAFHEAAGGGAPFVIEKRYLRKDGSIVWVNNTVRSLLDSEGRPFAILAVSIDVTERQAQEEALRESELRLRLALEAASLGTIEINLGTGTSRRSQRHDRIFGYDGAAPGWSREVFLEHVLPEDREAVERAYQSARDALASWHFTCRIRRADGAVRWIEAQGIPLRGSDGGPARMLGIVGDITERRQQEEALRASEERFRVLAEAMPQKVFTADASGESTYLNSAWEAFAGQASEEIPEAGWEAIIHPEDVEENRHSWEAAVAAGEPYEFEHRLRRYDGCWRWHLTRALPLRDASGGITLWVGSSTEIHDLKATQERLGFLVDLDRATRGLDDPDEVMAAIVRALGEELGANRCLYAEADDDEDRLDVIGDYTRDTFSLVGELRVSDFGPEALRLLRSGEPYVFEDASADARISPAHREAYRQVEAAAAVCVPLLRGGRLTAVVAVHQKEPRAWTPDDIDLVRVVVGRAWEALLRARALRALRESEARYRALTELSPQLVYTARPDGSIDYYNQEWYDYTGMGPDDSLDDWVEAVHPDHRQRAHEAFLEAIRMGTEYEVEIPLQNREGEHRWHLDRARPIRDETGEITRWIGVAVETHHRVEAQAQLEALNASLEERVAERTAVAEEQARQIRRLAAELTRAEQRERRRIATTLHDHLQQLLAAARFHLQAPTGRAPALDRVDDLLSESIEVSRSLTVQLSPPVLHEAGLGAGLAWLARWMDETHGLEVALSADEDAEPEDEHVRILLFEAVRELLFNTAKHAGVHEAEVTVETEGPHSVRITVRDAGVGFETSHPTTPPLSGLGLPSIRERLGYVGGEVSILSRPGQGTRVTLLAPRTASPSSSSHAEPPTQRPSAEAQDAVGQPLVRPIRVLLVDDHQILRAGLISLLRDESGIEVVGEAEDGVEAVDLALTLEPDVILMDVTMPRMGGIAATRRITAKLPGVRIVGLSMHTEADMAARLREAGAAAYITKGGPPALLVRTIREVSEPE